LLADSYKALPRHEIARVSELLQSQLLQPINIIPVQPSLAESNLFILEESGPSDLSFNEFNPLFIRNRLALQPSGVFGSNNTLGDEVTQSGVWEKFSYSLGQFHFETDGFRENNDLTQDIYNVFAQADLSPSLSVQTELRHRELEHGYLGFNFNLFDLDPLQLNFRRNLRTDTVRGGVHFTPASHSEFIASAIYADGEEDQRFEFFEFHDKRRGYITEGQYLFRVPRFNTVTGGGYYDVEVDNPFFTPPLFSVRHRNGYLYSYIRYPDQIAWTLGFSFDSLDDESIGKFDTVNPKFGMIWNLTPNTTLRLAAFRVLKRTLIANQTIEPTQVAGFNQFFDDFNGTESRRYGIALDQKFSPNLYGGLEVSRRDLKTPILRVGTEIFDQEEDLYRAYLDWAPHSSVAISWEYQMERFNTEVPSAPNTITHIAPLTFRYFHPSGLLGRVSTTYIDQEQEVDFEPTGLPETRDDQFVLVDAGIGYRLPRRYGIISFEVRNLFDEDFKFRGLGLRTSVRENESPPFLPERTIFARFILAF
jgi:hypothetical protein